MQALYDWITASWWGIATVFLLGWSIFFAFLLILLSARGLHISREPMELVSEWGVVSPLPQTNRRDCSWCGTTMLEGVEPASHGICAGCLSEHFGMESKTANAGRERV